MLQRLHDFNPITMRVYRVALTVLLMSMLILTRTSAQGNSCALVCNDLVSVSLGVACEAEVTYDAILEGEENPNICSPNAPSDFSVTVMESPNGPVIPEINVVNQSYVGQTLPVTVTHIPSGNFCESNITVVNQLLPSEVDCPGDIQLPVGISTDPANTGIPTDTDCADLTVNFEDERMDMSMMCNEVAVTITRTWTLTNPQGTEVECVQEIGILRPDIDDVEFPPNRNGVQGPVLDCADYDLSPDSTGVPSVNGEPISLDNGLLGFSASFHDKQVDNCGNTFTIIRTWTVVDPCTGEVERSDQIIIVKDTTPPNLICPTDTIRVSTNSPTECTADVQLPMATATDDCSATIFYQVITPDGPMEGNGGLLMDVPAGIHNITYEAADECGNVATCTIVLVVEDRTGPTIIGDDRVTASINNNGVAIIRPQALVLDVFDNCCEVTLDVKRMNEPDELFRDAIEVACEDIGQDVMVIVRATDCNGNSNFTMVPVEVIDKLPPSIICPPDVTLQCTEDFLDLSLTGEPTIVASCGAQLTASFSDQTQVDDCGQGTILRTWTVNGTGDTPVTCVQQITLIDTVDLNITYPPEYTSDQCFNPEDIHPDNLPGPFNAPAITGEECKMLAIGYEDQILSVNDEVCTKILRTWTIIDWCVYNPNSQDDTGLYQGTQLIKIEDNTPPEFRCPDDFTFDISGPGPDTLVLPEVTFDECLKEETQFLVSGDLGPGLVHPNVQVGTYDITYTLIDICGNTSSCTFTVTVTDSGNTVNNFPIARCIQGLTISIMEGGMAEIWANDFDAGSEDDFTPADSLLFRMEPYIDEFQTVPPEEEEMFYSCQDTGIHMIAMWVGDGEGNWDYCLTLLEIIDQDGICDGTENDLTIAGQVNNPRGGMVDNIEVNLMNSSLPAQMTKEKGNYRFSNVPRGGNYEVYLKGKGDAVNGVSTRDMIKIRKHILGIEHFDSPYKHLAADTDNSGDITTIDLIALQRLILGISTEFDAVPSWRFVSAYYEMPVVTGNQVPDIPEMLRLEKLDNHMLDADFMAVKMGDVTFDAVYMDGVATPRSLPATSYLQMERPSSVRDGMAYIPVRATESMELTGLQWTLRSLTYDLEGMRILPQLLQGTRMHQQGNRLALNWFSAYPLRVQPGDVLFTMVIPADEIPQNTTDWFIGDESRIASLLFDGQERPYRIDHVEKETSNEEQLLRIIPNPFRDETTLSIALAQASSVVLRVWSSNGQLVYERREQLGSGQHTWSLRSTDLPASGAYFYTLQADDLWQEGQFIRQ